MPADSAIVRAIRLDRHPGASRGPAPVPSPYAEIHDTAARQDGIVKIITGLIFLVFSLGLAAMGVLAVHALLQKREFLVWAFAIGVPGILLSLLGVALMAWGAIKLLSGRGRG